jgi:hypothetical protein
VKLSVSVLVVAHGHAVGLEVVDVEEAVLAERALRVGQIAFAGDADMALAASDDVVAFLFDLAAFAGLHEAHDAFAVHAGRDLAAPPISMKVGARSMRLTKSSIKRPPGWPGQRMASVTFTPKS